MRCKLSEEECQGGKTVVSSSSNVGAGTYVVAMLSEPVRSWVKATRSSLDHNYDDFPVEVTLAGSSGVGCLSPGQPLSDVVPKLQAAISGVISNYSTEFRFSKQVHQFPGTEVFVLTPNPAQVFLELHAALKTCGVAYETSRFPFRPHCTVYNGAVLEKLLQGEPERQRRRDEVRSFFQKAKITQDVLSVSKIVLLEADLSPKVTLRTLHEFDLSDGIESSI